MKFLKLTPQEYMIKSKPKKITKDVFLSLVYSLTHEKQKEFQDMFLYEKIELLVELRIAKSIKDGTDPYIEHRQLAGELKCSTKTVQRVVRKMEKEGSLKTIRKGDIFEEKASTYELLQKGLEAVIELTRGFYGISKKVVKEVVKEIKVFAEETKKTISKVSSFLIELRKKKESLWTYEENELYFKYIRGEI